MFASDSVIERETVIAVALGIPVHINVMTIREQYEAAT